MFVLVVMLIVVPALLVLALRHVWGDLALLRNHYGA
jgi:hypothetical protein